MSAAKPTSIADRAHVMRRTRLLVALQALADDFVDFGTASMTHGEDALLFELGNVLGRINPASRDENGNERSREDCMRQVEAIAEMLSEKPAMRVRTSRKVVPIAARRSKGGAR